MNWVVTVCKSIVWIIIHWYAFFFYMILLSSDYYFFSQQIPLLSMITNKFLEFKMTQLKTANTSTYDTGVFHFLQSSTNKFLWSLFFFRFWECCVLALCCAAVSASCRTSLSSQKAPTRNSLDDSLQRVTTHFLCLKYRHENKPKAEGTLRKKKPFKSTPKALVLHFVTKELPPNPSLSFFFFNLSGKIGV